MKNWKNTFIKVAEEFQKHSTCCRLKVGCVIVKNNRILSTGYNGVPSGMQHCEDVFKDKMNDCNFREIHHEFSSNYELHAEQNAISFAVKNGINLTGADIYVTTFPCHDCLKLIKACGIYKIYYKDSYDREMNSESERAKKFEIEVEKI